ncbi:MAG: chemotaxis protein CheA [Gemmatimonadota bacterium]
MSMTDPERDRDHVEDLVGAWLDESRDGVNAEPDPLEEADPEILESFVVECIDLLEEAEQAVLHLETRADDDSIAVVFRCFHTIKGTGAFLALDHISGIAHEAETLLSRIRERAAPLDAEVVDLLIRSIDVLGESAREARVGNSIPLSVEPLRRALQAAVGGGPAAGAADDGPRYADGPQAIGAQRVESGAGESWTRVRTDRLDRLLEAVGEMVVTQSMLAREAALSTEAGSHLAQMVGTAGKNVRALQELSVGMRLVPMRSLFRRMDRLVHDLGRRSGKSVRLVTTGDETEIDRNLIEELSDPFLHMLRNAVDHGVESAKERHALGKPDVATLELSAFRRGSNVVLRLTDDGRGLDTARVRERAVQRGWLPADRQLTEAEVIEYIFAPGFSTAAAVTEMSGRGVGLDVVRRNLQSLNGRIQVTSAQGRGCVFEVEVPLTLALTDGMIVRVGAEDYILPVSNMVYSFQPDPETIRTVAGKGEMVILQDAIVPLVRLSERLGLPAPACQPPRQLVVLVASGDRRCALLVDQLTGQQQVVTKPLSPLLGRSRGVAGSAILGNGRVGLILDVAELLEDTI